MNFLTLDLNLLRVFDLVMVERNVTRAAGKLATTQPAVSNALRRLREATGDELFIPGPTGVTPTPHAQAVWPAVRAAMDSLRSAFDPQAFDPATDERCFTLAMADATAAVLLPSILTAIDAEHARVELRVEPLTTRDPRPALEKGAADAGIGFFPDVARALAGTGSHSEFMLNRLYECEYVCVMRNRHPLAQTLTLDDYCAAQHVRVNFTERPLSFVDEALELLERPRRVMLTVNNFSTAARVVHESNLLGVFPRSYVPASGLALTVRPLPFPLPRIDVAMLWHRRHERDPAHRWLRNIVERVARVAQPAAGELAAIAPEAAGVAIACAVNRQSR
jgi:DNA-binding transcriptional LysR family regulator